MKLPGYNIYTKKYLILRQNCNFFYGWNLLHLNVNFSSTARPGLHSSAHPCIPNKHPRTGVLKGADDNSKAFPFLIRLLDKITEKIKQITLWI